MNWNDIEALLHRRTDLRSVRHLILYVKIIKHFVDNPEVKDGSWSHEKHHILPRKLWPEFEKEVWNIVVLPTKAHYLSHYLLFKAFSNRSCAFAFNQMRRVSKKNGRSNCRLYAAVRKEIAQHISETNTGRACTPENKLRKSKLFQGTNIYRNQDTGELQRFKVDTQPTNWVPFQTGRIRTDASKSKMSSIMSNRQHQYNPETREVRFESGLLPGFVQGLPDWIERDYNYLSDLIWTYNPQTGEHKRIRSEEQIPQGFVEGRRYNNVGFQQINNPDYLKVINLDTKISQMIHKTDFDPRLHMQQGPALDKIVLYKYNNTVYLSYKLLLLVNPELLEMPRNLSINEKKVSKPHANMTPARKKFCEKHQGKTMNELGLYAIRLVDYIYNKDEIYVESN